jgi:hypothetical protein
MMVSRSQKPLGDKTHLITVRIGRFAPSRTKKGNGFYELMNLMNLDATSGGWFLLCSAFLNCKTKNQRLFPGLKFIMFIYSLVSNSLITSITDSLPNRQKNSEFLKFHQRQGEFWRFLPGSNKRVMNLMNFRFLYIHQSSF